jgi:ribosomal protein L29
MKKEIFDGLSLEDLQNRLAEERSRLQKLRFSNSITPLPNSNEIRGVRKNVARMLTAITQKQQA